MFVIDDLTVRIAGRSLLDGASARIPTAAELSKARATVVDAIAETEEEWLAASEALQTA